MFLKKTYPPLQQALSENALENATEFQKKTIARIKSGGDLLAVAGSEKGKTTALAIGLIQLLKEEEGDVPRALVLINNHEKLEETAELFKKLAKNTSLRIGTASMGGNILDQKDAIYFGFDIVLAIPARISQLMSIEGINVIGMRYLVIDDAHIIMRNPTLSFVYRIFESLPKSQLMIFSEEETDSISRFIENFMRRAEVVRE